MTRAQVLPLSGLDGSNGFRIDGTGAQHQTGISVASAGDVDGDGREDLLIGSDAERCYVVFGTAGTTFPATLALSGLDGSDGFRIDGETSNDGSCNAVSSAGDVDGDGVSDLIIGARLASPGGRAAAGRTYVVFGRDGGGFGATLALSSLDGSTGFRLDGAVAGDLSGEAVAAAGDVNGDGLDDVIVGASGADPNGEESGSAFVLFGRSDGFPASIDLGTLNGSDGFRLNGASEFDYAGIAVSGAGDLNADGFDDIVIGARRAAPGSGSDAGSSYVVYGRGTGFTAVVALSSLNGSTGFRIDGAASADSSGRAVAAAGDVNGDGRDDLVIGARTADPAGLSSAGSSYVLFGRSSPAFPATLSLATLDGSNGFRIDGVAIDDASGSDVAGAGDLNGDDFSDIVIGAPSADPTGTNAGSVYVVHGRNSGFPASLGLASLDGGSGYRIDGVTLGNFAGVSVAAAGDINGDGTDDLVLGADGADPGATNAGSAFVVFGVSERLFRDGFE